MSMSLLTVLVVVGVALLFYLRLRYAMKKSVERIKRPPATIDEGSVQCFSCGMVVPRDKALEKKGRYFCGIKRNDREGRPIAGAAAKQQGGGSSH